MESPQDNAGDVLEPRVVSYVAARARLLRAMIREACERGLTLEERTSLGDLARVIQALVKH